MGFRLSSAIAGFATRTSENLDELQTKADDIAKTAAARYANEALQVRKERMKSRQEYLEAATNLKNNYGLSNNQIEVILSGGIANKDLFIQRMKDIEDEAFSNAKASGQDMSEYKFDNVAALGKIFTGEAQGDGRAIMEQAKLFAAKRSPFASPNMQELGDSISKSTKTIFGAIGPEYGMQQFEAQLKAQAGEMPEEYDITSGFGDTGLTARLQGLSMAEKRAIEQFELTKETTQLTNEQLKENNAWISQLKEAELEKLNLGNELFEVQIETAELENTNLGYKNSMLNDQLTDWRDWGQDLNKSTKEAELNAIMTDILNSKDTTPAQVLGGLIKERQRIESGALDNLYKTPEDKKAAIEQLTTQITRTQAIMTTMYEAQKSGGKDLYGIQTMTAYHESFKADAYEEVGITSVGKVNMLTMGGKTYPSTSQEYKAAKLKAEKIAGDKFKFMFVPDGVAMNDAAASIARSIDEGVVTEEKTNTNLKLLAELPLADNIMSGVTSKSFVNNQDGKVALFEKIKEIYEGSEVELPNNADLAKMINDAIAESNKISPEKQEIINLFAEPEQENPAIDDAVSAISASTYTGGKFKGQIKEVANYNRAENKQDAYEKLSLRIANQYFNAGTQNYANIPPEILSQVESVISKLGIQKGN